MKLFRRIRSLLRRSKLDHDFDEEVRQHLDLKIQENLARGMTSKEAHRTARLEFGNTALAKEHSRASWGFPRLENVLQDVRYATRQMRKNPGFSAIAVLTLALGIGATTAVFSVVNAVLLRPLPYRDPQRLVYLWEPNPHIPGVPVEAWGPMNADFYDWQSQSHSFAQLAMFTTDDVNLSLNGTGIRVLGSRVTADFFQVLGVAPELGRAVQPEDDQPDKERVVVISHALWQSLFASDRGVLGKELLLDAKPYRIIGVMPAGFAFPHGEESVDTVGRMTDVWVPWAMTAQEKASREDAPGTAIGRLRPGVSLAEAQSEISALTARFDSLHPTMLQGAEALLRFFDASITGRARRVLLIFMGAVFLVLLIACGNVAGLVLARATGRSLEISVRTALGASRWRLIQQLITESLCLAGLGAILGGLAASISIQLLSHINPHYVPRVEETSIDVRVLLFTVCVAAASSLVFGLLPAWSLSRGNLNDVLKTSGKRSIQGGTGGLQRMLLVGQVGLTVVLLAGSGLLIRSLLKLLSVDKGFAPASVLAMSIQLDQRYNQPGRQNEFFRNLLERAAALPGIDSAAAIDRAPLGGGESIALLVVEGHPYDPKTLFESRSITPRYFTTMGIPLLAGRAFTDGDVAGRPPVAIVSQSFVRRYFPGQNPIGQRFRYQDPDPNAKPLWWTIVGVAGDVRQFKLEDAPLMQIYEPLWQSNPDRICIVARSNVAASQLTSEMRALLRELDPALALGDVHTMSQLISTAAAERRFQTLLLSAFGGIALFLSLVGLYGLMAYSVQQRTNEIGIRMALGAQRRGILQLILRQGSMIALAGVLLGIMAAWGVTRLMANLLFEVKPTDAMTFLGVAVLFCAVALAACYIPARRATRVDPMEALRDF